MTTPTQDLCECGSPLTAWTYIACDHDMMFYPKTNVPLVVVEGPGELQQRAARACATCDGVKKWPRAKRKEND